jgi:drug/metabolite transporter (DMT)-like permease
MSRATVLSLYAMLVVIWSSTWVAIKFGLEDTPALLGAGVRFFLAGLALLVIAVAMRRSLRTDWVLVAILAALPFALSYGLVYWSEKYIPSGLAAVLFGVMPIYVAVLAALMLEDEPVHRRLFLGLGVALAGLVVAFGESIDLGHEEHALLGAIAGVSAPLCAALGNVAIKRRGAKLDAIVLNGWAMAFGGLLLLLVSSFTETWSDARWTGQAVGAIAYLAVLGSAVGFVVLTRLLQELSAVKMSYIPLIIPFGALVFGWSLYDEPLTLLAVAGAALVAAGLLVAQWPRPRGRAAAAADAGTGA